MNYALEILENDKLILEKCLSEWDCENYPEAKKERQKKLDSLNKAMDVLRVEIMKRKFNITFKQ